MTYRTAGEMVRNLMNRVARLERAAYGHMADGNEIVESILSELERRYIEPIEKQISSNGKKGYIGFESKDDAFQALYALKRAFPSVEFEVKSDRVIFRA